MQSICKGFLDNAGQKHLALKPLRTKWVSKRNSRNENLQPLSCSLMNWISSVFIRSFSRRNDACSITTSACTLAELVHLRAFTTCWQKGLASPAEVELWVFSSSYKRRGMRISPWAETKWISSISKQMLRSASCGLIILLRFQVCDRPSHSS